jgi:hypothetical protein
MGNLPRVLIFMVFVVSDSYGKPSRLSSKELKPFCADKDYRVSCAIGKVYAGETAPKNTKHYEDLTKEQSIAITVCYAFLPENTSIVYYGLDFLIPSGAVPDWCNDEEGCKTDQRYVHKCQR